MDIKDLTPAQVKVVELVKKQRVTCKTNSYGNDMWFTQGEYIDKKVSATLTDMVAKSMITLRRREVTVHAMRGTIKQWVASVTLEKAK